MCPETINKCYRQTPEDGGVPAGWNFRISTVHESQRIFFQHKLPTEHGQPPALSWVLLLPNELLHSASVKELRLGGDGYNPSSTELKAEVCFKDLSLLAVRLSLDSLYCLCLFPSCSLFRAVKACSATAQNTHCLPTGNLRQGIASERIDEEKTLTFLPLCKISWFSLSVWKTASGIRIYLQLSLQS